MTTPTAAGTALITGASTGIGATYAERLARRGHDLVLVARDRARLDALATRLSAEGGISVETLPADLTNRADLARVEARLRRDPAIGLLINNAGSAAFGTVAESDPDRLDVMIQLNTVAVTRLAAAAAAAFSGRRRGAIVNIGSVLALAHELSGAVYAGTKAYVLTFTQVLQRELAGSGVQVQAVLPGATRTEIWERAGRSVDSLPPGMVMAVGELVDAALAGLDQGEAITIPSLPDPGQWQAFEAARRALAPGLSLDHPAARYAILR